MSNLRFNFEWQDPAGAKGGYLATWASLSILIDVLRSPSCRTDSRSPFGPACSSRCIPWPSGLPTTGGFCNRRPNSQTLQGNADSTAGTIFAGARGLRAVAPLRADGGGRRRRVATVGSAFRRNQAWRVDMQPSPSPCSIRPCMTSRAPSSSGSTTRGLGETTLHEQWSAIHDADADEQEFCNAAARLGMDPYAVDSRLESRSSMSPRGIRPELLDDFLSLASADYLGRQAWCWRMRPRRSRRTPTPSTLSKEREAGRRPITWVRPPGRPATASQKGCDRVNGGNWKSQSLADLAGYLSIDQFGRCLLPPTGKCEFLDASLGLNRYQNPKFLIEKRREDSRQFAFRRVLFEHLTSPRDRFAVVSRLHTDRQQASRAFAAEFLCLTRC